MSAFKVGDRVKYDQKGGNHGRVVAVHGDTHCTVEWENTFGARSDWPNNRLVIAADHGTPAAPSIDVLQRAFAPSPAQFQKLQNEHFDMLVALDKARVFLASHSFASCSLAAQREAREVMGVVLAAIDGGKAGR